jgi:hypothetical protein
MLLLGLVRARARAVGWGCGLGGARKEWGWVGLEATGGAVEGIPEREWRDRSEKKEISVQPMTGLCRLLRAQGGETTFARSGGPDVTGARPGQTLTTRPTPAFRVNRSEMW